MATYISKQSGLWSSASTWLTAANGTFAPTADAGQPPQSGGNDKIVIRGNVVVEYDVSGMFGDGTSTAVVDNTPSTLLSNAICLSGGTLKASRTVSTSLTVNGSIAINYGADVPWFDWGTEEDPLSAVNANIYFGNPATTTANVFGFHSRNGTTPDSIAQTARITLCGKHRTRNTELVGNHSTNTTSLTVVDCTGWQVGDRIVTESISETATPNNTFANITNITGNVVTINSPLVAGSPSGSSVGNFNSNIMVRPGYAGAWNVPCNSFGFSFNANGGNGNSRYLFKNVSFDGFAGIAPAGTAGVGSSVFKFDTSYARNDILIENISIFSGTNIQTYGFTLSNGSGYRHTIKNVAFFVNHQNAAVFSFSGGAAYTVSDFVVYRTPYLTPSTSSFYDIKFSNLKVYHNGPGSRFFVPAVNGYTMTFNNCNIKTIVQSQVFVFSSGQTVTKIIVDGSYIKTVSTIGALCTIVGGSANTTGTYEIRNCTVENTIDSFGGGNKTSKDFIINLYANNNNSLANKRLNSYVELSGNYSMRNRGIASYESRALVADASYFYYEKIGGNVNVPKRFVGYLRYDSSYGTANLPYITFNDNNNTSSVTQTFSCSPVPNTWQKFDLTVTPAVAGDITMTVFAQTSSTTARVYLDGLSFDPINKRSRHYGFEFNDAVPDRTIDALTTLSEEQVSAVSTINNLDYVYDASNYWSVTNPGLTAYTDLYIRDGNILDFGSKNIVVDNSAETALAYASSPNTVTIKTPLLSSGSNFIGLRTTGNIYLSSGSTIGEIDIYGNVFQATPVSLSGIYMEGTLAYNTDSPITIEYTDCTMGTVQNDGSAIVTIKKNNSTIANATDAQIFEFVPTILDVTLNGGYIAIYDNTGTRQYYQNTDGIIVLPSSATGNWTYRIARYGYQFIQGSFAVDPNTGATITIAPSYTPDNFVTSDPATVSGYTDLNTTEKIYNYLNYWSTTSSGIDYIPFYSKAFGSITINKNVNLDATAGSILAYNGSTLLTLKCSGLSEDVLFVSNGNVVAQNGATYSDDVKIRAANLDSEFILGGITSMTLYPSEAARDANTTPGDTLTGTIYRFLYGSTVSGVLLSGSIYARVNVAGTILLYSDAITLGRNELEFGTTGTLQQIVNNQKTLNQGIQKASKLIPHTTNI